MELHLQEDIKPLSLFRTDPASVIRQLKEKHRPLVITERGKPSAILVEVEDFERQREKMELMEAVLEGEKDFQEGDVKTLDQIFRQTRAWFAKK